MQNSATITSTVTQGGTINSTVTVGTTIQSTLTGGGIGPKGDTGGAGTPGTVWHQAAGAPSTLYANGDFFLNTATGDIYVQSGSSWGSPVGNIKGPAGTGGDMYLAATQTITGPKTFNLNTWLDKGSMVYNVMAYGAVGDGVTDDTTAIQAAINAAHAVGGGVVLVPMGTHIISAALTVYPNIIIKGNGINVSVIKQITANTDAFTCTDVYYGGFVDIEIKSAVGHTSGSAINMNWSSAGNVEQMYLQNLLLIGFHVGITAETLITSTIDNVEANTCDIGFLFTNGGTSTTINNTYANNCQLGYSLTNVVYMSFNGTACDSASQSYYFNNCAGITFNGSGCESGILLTAPSAPTVGNTGTGGTVLAGTYQVKISYVNAAGESVGSSSTSTTTTGSTSKITVTAPAAHQNATGYYAYITAAGGSTYYRQQTVGSPTPIGTNFVLSAPPTTSGANPLAAATADGRGWYTNSCVGFTFNGCWNYANPSYAFYTTNSGSMMINNFTENGPVAGAINGIFIDSNCARMTVVSPTTTSTNNLQLGGNITTLISDNGGASTIPSATIGFVTSPFTIHGSSGNMILNANPDGGAYNLNVDTTGVLALFGSSTATLNVALLDGYLELDALTATTVPYLDANKRFASSAITPTQLGYLSPATGTTGTGNLVYASAPTFNTSQATSGNWPTISIKNNQSSQFAGPGLFMYNTQSTMTTQAGVMMYAGINDVGISHGYFSIFTVDYTGAQQTQIAQWDLNAQLYTSAWPITITSGNMTVTSGNMIISSGNLQVTGANGTLEILASTDGGDFNILSNSASGTRTLAIYGSSAATLNLNLLDGALYMGSNLTISNTGVHTNTTFDTAGTGNVFKINGTQITAVTGTGSAVLATSPSLTTPTLGAATATTINKVTITAPTTSATLTLVTGSSLITAGAFALTLTSTATTNSTFPSGTHTLAGLDVAQTWSAVQTYSSAPAFNALPTGTAVASAATASTLMSRDSNGNTNANLFIEPNQAITVTSNAGTADINHGTQTFTNSSAAAMTITLTTTSAVDGQTKIVRVYDFSAVAQTITWVNTENSGVSVPTTSNGSTTLPLTVGFIYNSQTSKWRCVASV